MQKIIIYITAFSLCLFLCLQLKHKEKAVVLDRMQKVSFEFDQIQFDQIPTLSNLKTNLSEEEMSKIVWNRWTIDKFSIHSLDKEIGNNLYNNVTSIKKEILNKWGLPNIDFNHEIRIFCCQSESVLKQLFSIEKSCFEFKKDKNVIYVWLVLENENLDSFKSLMMSVGLIELEHHYNYTFPVWIHRGMPLLSVNTQKTKESLEYIQKTNKTQKIEVLITTDYDAYNKLEDRLKKSFDVSSSLLCLMIRKEYGQDNFHKCMLKNTNIVSFLKFENSDNLNEKFRYYCAYLRSDFINNKIDENYIIITAKQ